MVEADAVAAVAVAAMLEPSWRIYGRHGRYSRYGRVGKVGPENPNLPYQVGEIPPYHASSLRSSFFSDLR